MVGEIECPRRHQNAANQKPAFWFRQYRCGKNVGESLKKKFGEGLELIKSPHLRR